MGATYSYIGNTLLYVSSALNYVSNGVSSLGYALLNDNVHNDFLNSFKNAPTINIGNLVGSTGYIDFIKQDMVHAPVTQGVDVYGRNFIVLRGKVNSKHGGVTPFFQTFFKRYSKENLWVGCGHYGKGLLITYGGMNEAQKRLLSQLIYKGKVVITNDDEKDKYKFRQEDTKSIELV